MAEKVEPRIGIFRTLAVAILLLAGAGGALGLGYYLTGGRDGIGAWSQQFPDAPFRGGAALCWIGAVAIAIAAAIELRAGVLGAVGAGIATVGAGLAAAPLASGGDVGWTIAGLLVWAAGVGLMLRAVMILPRAKTAPGKARPPPTPKAKPA